MPESVTCQHEKLYPDESYASEWDLMKWEHVGLKVNICKKCMLLYATKEGK